MAVSGVRDSAHSAKELEFEANNEDRISKENVPLLSPADLISLPIGQAFALLNGSELYKLRFPEPKPRPQESLPPWLETITNHLKSRHDTRFNWYEFEDSVDMSLLEYDT